MTKEYNFIFQRQRYLLRRTIFMTPHLYIFFACAFAAAGSDLAHASPKQTCGSPLTAVALALDGSALKAMPKRAEPCAESRVRETTLTFSGLDTAASVQTYSEDGYRLTGRAGMKPCNADVDCIRAMKEPGGARILAYAGNNINLSLSLDTASQDGKSFRLKSLKIRNPDNRAPTQSIMFVGKFADGSTTAFAITIRGNYAQDQLFMFPENFQNLVSVSWVPKGTAVREINLTN